MASCILLTSCSSQSEDDTADQAQLPNVLCETDISTSSLRKMYPGPYSETGMFPSKGGGINALGGAKGKTEGSCDVYITQKMGKVFTVAKIATNVEPGQPVDELFTFYKKHFPDYRSQQLTLGPAKGFTTSDQSVIVFECRNPKKRHSGSETLGVTVRILLPRHRPSLDVGRAKLAKGAANLAADTARYVHSEVLKCSDPPFPDGTPTRQKPMPAAS